MDKLVVNQGSKEASINSLVSALSVAGLFGIKLSTTGGMQIGLEGGNFVKSDGTLVALAATTVSLTGSATNYITAAKSDGTVSCSTSTTLWDDQWNNWRLWTIATGTVTISGTPVDFREIGSMTSAAGYLVPVTKTTSFTVGLTENELICAGSAAMTVTLPAAASFPGRKIRLKTRTAFAVNSASSNVIPLTSNTAGTAILAATAGQWREIVSNGTAWVAMAGN